MKKETDKKDEIVVKHPSYKPNNKDFNEVYSVEEDTGKPIEEWGDTIDEQVSNLVAHQFRPVKIRYEK